MVFQKLAALALSAGLAVSAVPTTVERDYVNYSPQVVTSYGIEDVTYQGFLNTTTNVEHFLAIPYAAPPVGSLRFKPTQPWTPGSNTTLDATQHGANCKQPGRNASKEDCLFINIARHTNVQSGEELPILLWIHGGDYISGAGDDAEFTPDQLVADSVAMGHPIIVASINYRLSAYGGLFGNQAIAANATNTGLLDQRMALTWLHEHAHAFGGNKDQVVIFGASAGGGSVVGQLILEGMNPKGLIAGCMHMSGAFIWNWQRQGLLSYQNDLYTSTGCVDHLDPVACMQALPEDTLFGLLSAIGSDEYSDNFGPSWGPGDTVFAESPVALIKKGYMAKVPIITGDTSDEFSRIVPYVINTSVQAASYMFETTYMLTNQDGAELWKYYANLTDSLEPLNTNATYQASYSPYYKRIATAISEIFFISNRQLMLEFQSSRSLPIWGYSFEENSYGLTPAAYSIPPQFGAPHYSDLPWWFGTGTSAIPAQQQLAADMRKALISFAAKLDPAAISISWDQFTKNSQLMRWKSGESGMVANNPHQAALNGILKFVGWK